MWNCISEQYDQSIAAGESENTFNKELALISDAKNIIDGDRGAGFKRELLHDVLIGILNGIDISGTRKIYETRAKIVKWYTRQEGLLATGKHPFSWKSYDFIYEEMLLTLLDEELASKLIDLLELRVANERILANREYYRSHRLDLGDEYGDQGFNDDEAQLMAQHCAEEETMSKVCRECLLVIEERSFRMREIIEGFGFARK